MKELRNTDDTRGADQVGGRRVDEARGEDVEVVGCSLDDNGVACIVSTGGARDDWELAGQEVDELALACSSVLAWSIVQDSYW